MDPDEYVSFCGTHCDHLVIPEPYKTLFFEGLRKVVAENGGKVVFEDTYVLYLTRKPGKTGDRPLRQGSYAQSG